VRNPPRLKYIGLTAILSHPGRFDTRELVSALGGKLWGEAFQGLGCNRLNVDIRTLDEKAPLLPETKVVLLCGSTTLGLIGQQSTRMNELRGSPFQYNGMTFIPTYHPQDATDKQAYEQRLNPQYNDGEEDEGEDDASVGKDHGKTSRANYAFWHYSDLRKAVGIARNGLHTNVCEYTILNDPAETLLQLQKIQSGSNFYLDIETDPSTFQITAFAFSVDAKRVWIFPFFNWTGGLVGTFAGQALMMRELANTMSRTRVVCHNALFDLFILMWKYKIPPPPQAQIYDTMIAHHRMYIGREKSLGHCVSFYTHQPYHKDEAIFRPTNPTQFKQFLLYNGKDVETMALVHQQQAIHAASLGAERSIADGCALIRPLLAKTYRGLLVDEPKWCARIDELRGKSEWFEKNVLPKLADGKLNPRSPDQVSSWLYEKHSFPRPVGNDSLTGKRQLYKLLLKYDIPLIRTVLACRKWSKEAGQLQFRLWRQHYATCSYTLTKVKTFRLSSRALFAMRGKKESGWGTNLQNWNKKTRQLIIPHPGNVFVQVDQAGAEAKIVAYYAPSGRYRDLFTYGVKPHTYLALHLFKPVWEEKLGEPIDRFLTCPIAELRNQPRWKELEGFVKASDNDIPARRYYFMAKCTCHSGNYDVREREFVMSILERSEGEVVIPLKDGERFLAVYRQELFPEIQNGFQAYVRQCMLRDRVLRNAFDYPYHIMVDKIETSDYKHYYAWIPQSTVGTITNLADCEIQEKLDSGEYRDFAVVQNNHDSLLFETPQGNEAVVAQIAQKHLNRRMVNPWGEEYFMGSEASVGPNWYNMKELKGA